MRVSLILPCRNEARHITACLDSLVGTEYPREDLELLVVDGLSDDGTREILARYVSAHPWIRVLDNPRQVTPAALNIGIEAAAGEVILRVDAHAVYPPAYVPRLVTALLETGADNVGGPVVTLPGGSGPVARAVALVLAHPLGVGNAWFRIGTSRARWVETVPYGCYPREVFRRLGGFDEELVRNQDDEFNYRLVRAGGRILLLPDAVSYYYARECPRLLARMLYQYGYFKPLVARKVGRVTTLRQLIPPAFVLAVVLGGLLAPLYPLVAATWGALWAVYGTALLIAGARVVPRQGLRTAAALTALFPVVHLAYGSGFLRGLVRAFTPARGRWRDPAAVPLTR